MTIPPHPDDPRFTHTADASKSLAFVLLGLVALVVFAFGLFEIVLRSTGDHRSAIIKWEHQPGSAQPAPAADKPGY